MEECRIQLTMTMIFKALTSGHAARGVYITSSHLDQSLTHRFHRILLLEALLKVF